MRKEILKVEKYNKEMKIENRIANLNLFEVGIWTIVTVLSIKDGVKCFKSNNDTLTIINYCISSIASVISIAGLKGMIEALMNKVHLKHKVENIQEEFKLDDLEEQGKQL